MSVETRLQQAETHIAKQQFAQAIALCRKILKQNPHQPIACYLMARALQAQGRKLEAQQYYQRAVESDANLVDAHLQLGNSLFMEARFGLAIASYERVIQLQPDHKEAHYYLGLAYRQVGRLTEAIASYERAIAINPDRIEIQVALGNAQLSAGQLDQAEQSYRAAIELNPNLAEAHNGLGGVMSNRDLLDQAASSYERAIELMPNYADAYANLGMTQFRQKNLLEALANCQQALQHNPNHASTYMVLGLIAAEQDNLGLAIAHYQKAIALNPNYANAYCNLGAAQMRQGEPETAIANYHKALAINPNLAEAYHNLGEAHSQLYQFTTATEFYQRAIQTKPNYVSAHNALATVYLKQAQPDQAIAAYRQAIALQPDYVNAHFGLSMALLQLGNFTEGLVEYEWRQRLKYAPVHNFPQLVWDGSDLTNKTILILPEQGFGDAIQFVRFLPMLLAQGGRIILQCRSPLVRLFQTIEGLELVQDEQAPLPDFDVYIQLMSLPRVLGIELATIPDQVPYLWANSEPGDHPNLGLDLGVDQADRPGLPTFKIGIVWASGHTASVDISQWQYEAKSIPLALLAPLLELASDRNAQENNQLIEFYSLQVGGNAADIEELGWQEKVIDLSDRIEDFADTAALIEQLDLIICVDTAVAHLAGAMAKPVWLLLPFAPDWRWFLGRDDSPWYPTMRLFRQVEFGDWQPVITQVRAELEQLIANPERFTPELPLHPLAANVTDTNDSIGIDTIDLSANIPVDDQVIKGDQVIEIDEPDRVDAVDTTDTDIADGSNSIDSTDAVDGNEVDNPTNYDRSDASPIASPTTATMVDSGYESEQASRNEPLAESLDLVNQSGAIDAVDADPDLDSLNQQHLVGAQSGAQADANINNPDDVIPGSLDLEFDDNGADQTIDSNDNANSNYNYPINIGGDPGNEPADNPEPDSPVQIEATVRAINIAPGDPTTEPPPESQIARATTPELAALLKNAIANHQADQINAAIALYRQFLNQQPEHIEANYLLGVALGQIGEQEQAIEQYQRVLNQNPNHAQALNHLGVIHKQQGQLAQAIDYYERAIAIQPDYVEALYHLGLALTAQGKWTAAIEQHQRAIALNHSFVQAYVCVGVLKRLQGDLAAAIDYQRRAIELKPNYAEAHQNLGIAFLLSGDYSNGLREYEWRWQTEAMRLQDPSREPKQPLWDGQPFPGKTLLIHTEQGLGDTIQFLRFVPIAKQRGDRIVVKANHDGLARLLNNCDGIDQVSLPSDPTPHFDLRAPLMSLAHMLGITLTTVPNQVPYLTAANDFDLELDQEIAPTRGRRSRSPDPLARSTGNLKVGIFWATTSRSSSSGNRSCPLAIFQSLFEVEHIDFYILQQELDAADLELLSNQPRVRNLSDRLLDLTDTAAAIAQLDLVISIDTMVVHLAGALAKPVWVLLPFAPDWRWQLERKDSIWYPTARLFRQPNPGDWQAVVTEISKAIQEFAAAWTISHTIQQQAQRSDRTSSSGAAALFKRAITYFQANRHHDATIACQQILQQHPDYFDALHLLGIIACQQKQFDRGMGYLHRAIAINPEYASAYFNLGNAYREGGYLAAAAHYYQGAIDRQPQNTDARHALGQTLQSLDRIEAAIACYQELIKLQPSSLAYFYLADLQARQGLVNEAIGNYETAIQLQPDFAIAYNNLGNLLRQEGQLEPAIANLTKALELRRDLAEIHKNMGQALWQNNQLNEALSHYQQALAIKPEYDDLLSLGSICRYRGDFDLAIAYFRQAIVIQPETVDGHENLGLVLLAQGKFEAGFVEYEWRLRDRNRDTFAYLNFLALPIFDGTPSNQTILILGEQGVGDEIIYASMLAEARNLGDRLVVACQERLLPLFRRSFGHLENMQFVSRADRVSLCYQNAKSVLPMGSLGRSLRPDRASFGQPQAYLQADPGLTQICRDRYLSLKPHRDSLASNQIQPNKQTNQQSSTRKLIIGISWHSSNRAKRLPRLEEWLPILTTPGVTLVNLQYGDWQEKLEEMRDRHGVEIFDDPAIDQMASLDDFAAQVAAVDLVISVSNTTVHMAGALGKPVWVLLPYVPELWFWQRETEDTLWYPQVKLCRQAEYGEDWQLLIQRIATNLSEVVNAPELLARSPLEPLKSSELLPSQASTSSALPAQSAPVKVSKPIDPIDTSQIEPAPQTDQQSSSTKPSEPKEAQENLDQPQVEIEQEPIANNDLDPGDSQSDQSNHQNNHQSNHQSNQVIQLQPRVMPVEPIGITIAPIESIATASPADQANEINKNTAEADLINQIISGHNANKQTIAISWPIGITSGWGIFGLNLALNLSRHAEFAPCLLSAPSNLDQQFINPLHYALLKPYLNQQQRLQRVIEISSTEQLDLGVPIVHALGNNLAGADLNKVGSDRNVGFIFFEDTYLDAAAIAKANTFDLILAGSSWNAEVLKGYGINNVHTVLQGIDPTLHHPISFKSTAWRDRFIVFSGGKLEYRKAQDIVVAAFKIFQARHPEALLITAWHNHWPQFMRGLEATGNVVGLPEVGSDRRLNISAWLQANGLPAGSFLDMGIVPNYLMPRVVQEADAAIFPNRCEGGTNLVAMECLACGIPTVISANTGHLDIINQNHCYSLQSQRSIVNPPDYIRGIEGWGESEVDEAVAALEDIFNHRDRAQAKGQAAAGFMQQLTWSQQVNKMMTTIKAQL
ncbi:glycosyl transferase family 9 [Thalassoporum mexicanum PCC 7367]|uniref:tetratricopeptide repeat protein n=1 Tax=Thalassoporum mexicanum TaxID=3457544 RepID=UPI00029FDF06|nr:tetratricopeptide repeat protein [Pseudanabaena sp. PCC 7367]AFY70653.1 glycosyl transferase family 9 [Pseudanabaena sp. PCC 7367]